jgi:hypothetical protein
MNKITFLLFFSTLCIGQVGIGTTTPDASSILDVTSNDKGILIPRISLVAINNLTTPINAPATGLMIWNTNSSVIGGNGVGFYFFNGSVWQPITSHTLNQAYNEGGLGNGRTIIADVSPVRIDGTDGLLVTGTHGSGATLEASTTNSKMFFYPRKSAFRAGFDDSNSWVDLLIGDYSAAFGRNNIVSGVAAFGAGDQNSATGNYASTFGTFNTSSGVASFSSGNNNLASGENSFVGGNNSIASGVNSLAIGRGLESPSFAEAAFGSYNTTYVPASNSSFVGTDRIFSIGYGSGSGARRDAFEVYKDGRVRINNIYNLPLTDGTSNQVITTDGAGNLSWTNQVNDRNITTIPLYAANSAVTMNSATFSYVNGTRSAVIPSDFNALGNVQVKCVIKYNSISGGAVTDNQFQVRANNTNIIVETDTWTNTATATGGVYECQWKNWNGGTNVYQVLLRGLNTSGNSMDISNVYIQFKSQ